MTRGRPSTYDPKFCDLVIKMMSKGASKEAVAAKLGISRDTLYEWCRTHDDFSYTIKVGHASALNHWEKIGIDGMMGKIPGFKVAVWIFTMKNRFSWRDELEIKEEVIETPQLPQLPKEDPQVTIERILEKHGKKLAVYYA